MKHEVICKCTTSATTKPVKTWVYKFGSRTKMCWLNNKALIQMMFALIIYSLIKTHNIEQIFTKYFFGFEYLQLLFFFLSFLKSCVQIRRRNTLHSCQLVLISTKNIYCQKKGSMCTSLLQLRTLNIINKFDKTKGSYFIPKE